MLLANEMNGKAQKLDNRMQYDFYKAVVQPRSRFKKWTKTTEEKNVEVVMEYYNISKQHALPALKILNKDDIKKMIKHLDRGGVK